jgi:hypothetical protein
MVFGIAPAFDMIVDDPAERAVLLGKLAPLVKAGFRDFELGFDDIEFSVKDPVCCNGHQAYRPCELGA